MKWRAANHSNSNLGFGNLDPVLGTRVRNESNQDLNEIYTERDRKTEIERKRKREKERDNREMFR